MDNMVINRMPIIYNDEYINQIPEDLFNTTMAFKAYQSKQLFILKIGDFGARRNMMKNIVTILENDLKT